MWYTTGGKAVVPPATAAQDKQFSKANSLQLDWYEAGVVVNCQSIKSESLVAVLLAVGLAFMLEVWLEVIVKFVPR